MARTDAAAIGLVIELDPDISLVGVIRTANVMVNNLLSCATANGIAIDSDTLTEIETWLAAHLYAHQDPQYSEKRTEKAMGKFQGQTGMGLESTMWGQTALLLDPSGCLKGQQEQQLVGGFWLGKSPTEQIPYDQRR